MESDIRQILKRLQQICGRQEKCKADIIDYLFRQGIPEESHPVIINQLIAERFIDEERYARAAALDKFRLNRWGKIKIRYFLRSKRIPDGTIEEAIALIDEDEYRQSAGQELKKKAQTLKKENREQKKAKLLQFSISRGYEERIVREILMEIMKEEG